MIQTVFRLRYKLLIVSFLCLVCISLLKDNRTIENNSNVDQLNNPVSLTKVKKEVSIPEGCVCTDKNGNKHNFCYINPSNLTMIGTKMDCKHMETMQELGLLEPTYIDLSMDEMPDPQFVTAISGNHIAEGRYQLKHLRELWPKRKLIVYDLGLGGFRKEYEKDPLVELRDFPFDKYPKYVKTLNEYRWKPIIIASMLKEFGAIFYMDSSINFKDADLDPIYDLLRCKNENYRKAVSHPKYLINSTIEESLKLCNKSSYLFHRFPIHHSIYATTQAGMYDYLPISKTMQTTVNMYEAGVVTVVRTKEAVDNIVKWYVLCALEEKCMSPPGATLYCNFKSENHQTEFANCHRYDQSAVNILSANFFNGDTSLYGTGVKGYLVVGR